jgi:hypothetical protein
VFHNFNCIEGKERHSNRIKGNLVCKINSNQYNFQQVMGPVVQADITEKKETKRRKWRAQIEV